MKKFYKNAFRAKLLLIVFLSNLVLTVHSQVIPSDKRVNWGQIVDKYQFREPTTRLNIMDYGGDSLGQEDNTAAFTTALSALNGHAGVIYFPAGRFMFESTISLPDSVVLAGAGTLNTNLLFDLRNQPVNTIQMTGSSANNFVLLDGGFEKGSNKLWTASTQFQPGDWVEIREENGSWDTQPVSWADYSVGQIEQVLSVDGDTIFLSNPLRIDYDTNLKPQIQKITPVVNSGVQCMTIKRLDGTGTGGGYNIYFNLAVNCRVRAIVSDSSNASHVFVSRSSMIRVEGSTFRNAFLFDGVATHGYGVTVSYHSGGCLITNNIFHHLRHAMMAYNGANGNVFSYNYSFDVIRTEFPNDASGDISLHGHYPFANLFEGNVVQNIVIDDYWGIAGPWNTFFRNRAESWGIGFYISYPDIPGSINQNFVGNQTTNTTLLHGQFTVDLDSNFVYGNNILGQWVPSGTYDLSDSSYYLSSAPEFWNETLSWPPPMPASESSSVIPSVIRYHTGEGYNYCDNGSTTGIENPDAFHKMMIYPNPNHGFFYSLFPEKILQVLNYEVYSLDGKMIYKNKVKPEGNRIEIRLPDTFKSGMYFIRIGVNNKVYRNKILLL
ncbi:MAG: T9SS type A sorting domain-containing protein [Bacteroidales bacterium]|nr:T9SS type A sorting domain-containing protein [Bacteroidales bacterium]